VQELALFSGIAAFIAIFGANLLMLGILLQTAVRTIVQSYRNAGPPITTGKGGKID
jgi:hypothetical protein